MAGRCSHNSEKRVGYLLLLQRCSISLSLRFNRWARLNAKSSSLFHIGYFMIGFYGVEYERGSFGFFREEVPASTSVGAVSL